MKFYRNTTEIYDIRPEDDSTQRIVHMGENVLNLTFRTATPLDLRVNDFVVFNDEKYKLKQPVNPTRKSRHEFEYQLKMFSPQYDLQDALYVLEDDTGVGVLDDTIPLYGTASFHLQRIVKCARVVHPEWRIGDVEEPAEGRNIVYTDMDCLQALQHLCTEFNIEYWITGTTISLGKKKHGSPIPFRYGKGNALYDLSRINQDGRIVTKLLVKGGDRNIDGSTYGSKYLHLPNGERYVTRNTDKFGVIMGRASFPDVFPRLIHKQPSDPGSVTGVRMDESGVYWVKDANLDFEPELLPGKNLVVDFQTGQLGGVKIDANYHPDTKEYELIRGDYGLGQEIPGGLFVPAVGDLYLLSDLKMPQAYIDAAERELLEKGQEAIAQMCEQKVSYKGAVNPLFFRQLGERIETGRAVIVEDSAIVDGTGSVELRVQAFTRSVNDDLSIDIEISDTLYVSRIDKIETTLQEVKTDTNERINYGDAYTRRRWRDAEETAEMLKAAQLNFSEAINPIVVQTMQLLVGDRSLQFRFVNSKTNPQAISYLPAYNKDTKILRCSTAILQHMTLGIDTVSSSHIPSEYKFWDMALFTGQPLTESSRKYYLYARVPKSGTAGTFLLSEPSIGMEQVAGYYHLLVGVLNSEYEGERSFVRLYGFTEILPGQVFTDVISDPDRSLVIDLVAKQIIARYGAQIIGKITFESGTSGYANIADRPNLDALMDGWLFDADAHARQIAQQAAGAAQSNATATAITNIESAREALAKNLGYASYNDLVTKAAQGKTIINGGYVRTSLIDAAAIVTQELVAMRLTASMIEALNIVTSRLTATSGAKIGSFTIENGWLKSTTQAGSDVGYIDMRYGQSRIAFGNDLIPGTAGGAITLTSVIHNLKKAGYGGATYALDLRAAGDANTRAVALSARGGVVFKGNSAFVEESPPLNTNISNSSYSTAENLKWYRNFVFQAPTSGYYADIYLPNDTAIEAAFGYFETNMAVVDSSFIRIYLLCTRYSSGYFRVKASSSTPIIGHSGTIDYIEIAAGSLCCLTYHNRAWYFTNSNWDGKPN
jgi:hypothetical protein